MPQQKMENIQVIFPSFYERSRKNFLVDRFLESFYSSQSFLCQKCKMMGVTDFVSEIKRVENYPDFENSVHVIQHCLQGEEPSTRSLQLPHIPVRRFHRPIYF